ncbi:hypothetical protein Leryth_000544 [Lithospermum erythrorhizon]|nr:hypothetical protein Leryth_000544 [Lithospermum erythrorhizon]
MKTTTTTHFHHHQPLLIPTPSRFISTSQTFKYSNKYTTNAYSSSSLASNSTREENVGSELCACTRREVFCATAALFFVPLANAVDGSVF